MSQGSDNSLWVHHEAVSMPPRYRSRPGRMQEQDRRGPAAAGSMRSAAATYADSPAGADARLRGRGGRPRRSRPALGLRHRAQVRRRPRAEATGHAATDFSDSAKVVNFHNWGSYIDIASDNNSSDHPTLDAFTKKYGIKVELRRGHHRQQRVLHETRPGPVRGQGHRRGPDGLLGLHDPDSPVLRLHREAGPLGDAQPQERAAGDPERPDRPGPQVHPALGLRLHRRSRATTRSSEGAGHRPSRSMFERARSATARSYFRRDGGHGRASRCWPSASDPANFTDDAVRPRPQLPPAGQVAGQVASSPATTTSMT